MELHSHKKYSHSTIELLITAPWI